MAPGGNVVADSTGKLHAVEDVVVLTASGILTVDVPSGYTKVEIECIGGGGGGGNGQGYPFTYVRPTALGGAGGQTTTGDETDLGGNGGSVEYIESGAGGRGDGGTDGTAHTNYQLSDGNNSGPHVGSVYSGDTGDFNGAGGRVNFMGRESDYGSGGKGGYMTSGSLDTTSGSNGVQGVIRIRFIK